MNDIISTITPKNMEILTLLAEQELGLREIAEKIKCSPSKVHQALHTFQTHGLIRIEKRKNKLLPKPNRTNPFYQKIKSLLNLSTITRSKTYTELKKLGSLGLYGSYAQGTDDAESDVDLVLVTDRKELEIRPLIRNLENELGRKINPLLLTQRKIEELEKTDPEFHLRLKLTLIPLWGDLFG